MLLEYLTLKYFFNFLGLVDCFLKCKANEIVFQKLNKLSISMSSILNELLLEKEFKLKS